MSASALAGSSFARGPIQDKVETAEAVRNADDGDGYEMQEVEGAVKRKYQGTAADRKEMSQLGRIQELRVCLERTTALIWVGVTGLTSAAEKLPIHLHGWFCMHIDCNMGGSSHHSRNYHDQWWNRRCDLGVHHCFLRLWNGLPLNRRDGVNVSCSRQSQNYRKTALTLNQGSHIWRSISLGFRMVAA